MEDKVYQTIACFRPRQLTTFTIGDDVFLLFIEGDTLVKVSEIHMK